MLLHVCDIRYACRSCFVLQMSRFTIRFWHPNSNCLSPISGWWFGTLFIFHNIWDNPSHWFSYFSRWLNHPPDIVDVFEGFALQYLIFGQILARWCLQSVNLVYGQAGYDSNWVQSTIRTACTRWCPPRYKLVLSPLTIDISPINHSYWSYVHQLSYRTGAPPCIHQKVWLAASAGYKRSWDPEIVDASLVASRICIRGWRGWWLIADIFDIHCGYVV